MKAAFKVYLTDLKNIVSNKATLVIIVGLIILPSMYAWFNIAALVDPYSNASNLPIAVYTNDEGTLADGEQLNIGDEVVANLHDNADLAWQFPASYQELEDKVNTGEYYAAIVIPKSFSSDLASAIDTYQSPKLRYIVNEKVNAIAPKMTEAGAEGITAEINSEVNSVVTKYIVDYSNELNDQVLASASDYNHALNSLNTVIDQFGTIDQAFARYDSITNDVDTGIELIDQFNHELTNQVNDIDYTDIYQSLTELSAIDGVDSKQVSKLEAQVEQVEQVTSQFAIEADTSDYEAVDNTISNFIYNQWPTYKTELVNYRDKLSLLEGDYDSISEYLGKDGAKASEFMASPVALKTEKLYPVANYGSASMPFYTTLCLWVGSLLMVSLLSTSSKLEVSRLSEYFGKLMLFLTIGILQAVIVSVGDFMLLDITVASQGLLILFAVVIVVVFVTIVYSLVYVFGNIGKALAIILLVLSISAGGGNFPIEVSGPFFNHVYPYLPFTYGVKLLREAGAGVYPATVNECLQILAVMMSLAICFGMIGARYLKDYFDRFDIASRSNGIIH